MENRKTNRIVDVILLTAVVGSIVLILVEIGSNMLQVLGS